MNTRAVRMLFISTLFLVIGNLPGQAQAGTFSCQVQSPIYRSNLNSGGQWHFEAFSGTPGATYHVKVNWPGDPSNGAHSNASIGPLDANGYGITYLPGDWSVDGFLPQTGPFSVQIYSPDIGTGNAKCKGYVSP